MRNNQNFRWMFLAAACTAVFALSGCGDREQEDSTGSSRPSVTAEATPQETQSASDRTGQEILSSSEPTPRLTPADEPTPETSPDSTSAPEAPAPQTGSSGGQASAGTQPDMKDYLENYKQLPELLGMERGEPWQFNEDNSYVKDGFYLEWLEGYGIFSVKNEQPSQVLLYGSHLGDPISGAGAAIEQGGWTFYSDAGSNYTYIAIFDGQNFVLTVAVDENSCITSWYLNNWPEGEFLNAYKILKQ